MYVLSTTTNTIKDKIMRRQEVEEFLKFLDENPQKEKEMMRVIKYKVDRNKKVMEKFYNNIIKDRYAN